MTKIRVPWWWYCFQCRIVKNEETTDAKMKSCSVIEVCLRKGTVSKSNITRTWSTRTERSEKYAGVRRLLWPRGKQVEHRREVYWRYCHSCKQVESFRSSTYCEWFPFAATGNKGKSLRFNGNSSALYMLLNIPKASNNNIHSIINIRWHSIVQSVIHLFIQFSHHEFC